jgi:GGDEF domain-containing protein
MSAPAPRFMVFEDGGRRVLQRHVEIFADVVVPGDGVKQLAGDAVGIGVEEAQPAQAFDAGERVEQSGEAVFEAEVFAVAGGVLADEGDLLNAARDELLCASATTDSKRRERNLPRRLGMTQKVQGWSQPSAIFM